MTCGIVGAGATKAARDAAVEDISLEEKEAKIMEEILKVPNK